MAPGDPSVFEKQQYRNDWINLLYGFICVLCFLLGTTLNSWSLYYFLRKPRHLSTLVYIAITTTDIGICVLSLPVSISYLSNRAPGAFGSVAFCQIWGVLWNALARMSVFLVAVLSISRTFSLKYPFKPVSKKMIVGLMVGYAVIQLLQSSIPFWFGTLYQYYDTHIQCQWFTHDVDAINNSEHAGRFYSALMWIELASPVFPILISCLISIIELHKHTDAGSKRAVTKTVVLFTVIYILFNLPFVTYFIVAHVDRFSGFKYNVFEFEKPSFNLRSFVVSISVMMNSTVNPMLYLFRFKRFRLFVVKVIQNRRNSTSYVFRESNSYSENNKRKYSVTYNNAVAVRSHSGVSNLRKPSYSNVIVNTMIADCHIT
ncbi:type-2 angiotensin II receptor-like [Bolinopsis microptera]|uniref:type-2 angiotensin II receptor-like n=1 Tax=Bolinopsis microptera TaxID=2820187 RepID=UPI00307AE053